MTKALDKPNKPKVFKYSKTNNLKGVKMPTSTLQVSATFSLAFNYNLQKQGIEIPSQIANIRDYFRAFKTKNRSNKEGEMIAIYEQGKEIASDFDKYVFKRIAEFRKKPVKTVANIKEVISLAKKSHEEAINFATEVKDLLFYDNRNPTVYFLIKKHSIISQIAFDNINLADLSEDVNIEDEIAKLSKPENKERAMLYGFIGLEKLFVFSAIMALERNDMKFISKYSELIDRFTYDISNIDIKKYMAYVKA